MIHDAGFLWYKLFRAEGFGAMSMYVVYKTIRNSGFSLDSVFHMDRDEFQTRFPQLGRGRFKRANFESLHKLSEDRLYEEYQELSRSAIDLIHPDHESYPGRLSRFLDQGAPLVLFCRGYLRLLRHGGIAIVGSRHASDEGQTISRDFAAALALQGHNVISGYAKGVDTSAHLGALEEDGTTTIVLSYGILRFSRKKAFHHVRWDGNTLVVSQFEPRARWSARNAMTRNKLVCALSKAVIVVESRQERDDRGIMSGTFDTAKTALQMGIPLFVVGPASFRRPALGNSELVARGGIEIKPGDGISSVLEHLETEGAKGVHSVTPSEQLPLFEQDSDSG